MKVFREQITWHICLSKVRLNRAIFKSRNF